MSETETFKSFCPYWVCDKCKINSLTPNKIIPCKKRGKCEAQIRGKIEMVARVKMYTKRAMKIWGDLLYHRSKK